MTYRPFRSLGRFLLAACAVSLGVASLGAQTPAATAPVSGLNPSRVDIFMGYSYFGAHGRVQPSGIPYSSINLGAIGSGAYYFNNYFGGEFIYSNHPDGVNDGMSGASVGVIARLPMENFTLFAHGLVGASRPKQRGPRDARARALPMGSGADRRRRYGLRPSVRRQPIQPPSVPG